MSKPMAIKFFNSVAGILSMDLREIVLACLKKLAGFLRKFEALVYSPGKAIRNIESKEPVIPKSFFKAKIELVSKSSDKKKWGRTDHRISKEQIGLKIPKTLINKISTQSAEKVLEFVLSPAKIQNNVRELVSKILSLSQKIRRPEHYIISSILKNLWVWGQRDSDVQREIDLITRVVQSNLRQVERVKDLILPFEFLWKKRQPGESKLQNKREVLKEDLVTEVERVENEFSLDESKARVKQLFALVKQVEHEVEEQVPSEIGLSLVLVDCSELKAQIRSIMQNLQLRLETRVSQVIFAEIRAIIKKFESSKSYLDIKFENASQLVQFEAFLEELRKKEFPELKLKFKRAVQWLREMVPFLDNLESFNLNLFRKGHHYITHSGDFLQSYGEVLSVQRSAIQKKIEKMKEHLEAKLEDGERELDEIRRVEHDYLSQKMLSDLTALQKRVKGFQKDSRIMEKEQAILGKAGTRLRALGQFEKDVQVFKEFWEMMETWSRVKEVERSPSLLHENIEELTRKVQLIRTNGQRLLDEFKKNEDKNARQVKMISGILRKLEEFWKEAEVLRFLCNPRLQARHWSEINRVMAETEKEVGLDGKLNANFELSWPLLEDLELSKEFEKLQRISQQADREFEIQEQLRDMRSFWERRVNLNSLFEARCFTKKRESFIKVRLNRESFEVLESVNLRQVEERLEQDLARLERVQLFKKFSLFKYEIEDLKMVVEKTVVFVEILKEVEKSLRGLGALCQSGIVNTRMHAKVKRAQEIEDRLRSILDSGAELGIDRVTASKENEYLLRNFEKELAKVHKELWHFVKCLKERPGRISWLNFEDILKGEDWVKISEAFRKGKSGEGAKAASAEDPSLVEQLQSANAKKAEGKFKGVQDSLVELGKARVGFLEKMAARGEAKKGLGFVLKKLFRGVKSFVWEKGHVTGVQSFNGEAFEFGEKVKIEISLAKVIKEIEEALKKSVQKKIYNGLGNYSVTDKKDFLEGRLNQIIFLVEMVVWTYEVESILLGEGSSGLADYVSHFYDFISNFSQVFRDIDKRRLTRQKGVCGHDRDHAARQAGPAGPPQGRGPDALDLPVAAALLHRAVGKRQERQPAVPGLHWAAQAPQRSTRFAGQSPALLAQQAAVRAQPRSAQLKRVLQSPCNRK